MCQYSETMLDYGRYNSKSENKQKIHFILFTWKWKINSFALILIHSCMYSIDRSNQLSYFVFLIFFSLYFIILFQKMDNVIAILISLNLHMKKYYIYTSFKYKIHLFMQGNMFLCVCFLTHFTCIFRVHRLKYSMSITNNKLRAVPLIWNSFQTYSPLVYNLQKLFFLMCLLIRDNFTNTLNINVMLFQILKQFEMLMLFFFFLDCPSYQCFIPV